MHKEWTPIRPKAGGLTHATSLETAHKTVCNRIAAGWAVSTSKLDCQRCKELIHQPIKRRQKR